MKKILILLVLLFCGISVQADEIYVVDGNLTMVNFWERLGKKEEKIQLVSSKIIAANKFDKRIPVTMDKTPKVMNASANYLTKGVAISEGFLPYMDSDDELAAVISHEMAHVLDFYHGFGRLIAMNFNSKSYEYKADLVGVDIMVKAGYNPIAMITCFNRSAGELPWEWGRGMTHPKVSKRLFEIYKYVYKKYPQYLNSTMAQSQDYKNWTYTAQEQINDFHRKEKLREMNKGRDANL